jgi:uncharacterized repeat protein (TIGR02543 family)
MPKVIKVISIVLAIFFAAPLFTQGADSALGNVNEIQSLEALSTAVAYDSVNNRYLQVFVSCPDFTLDCYSANKLYFLFGMIVDHEGSIVRSPFPIASITSNDYYRLGMGIRCDAKFDHINQHYLLVWPEYRNGEGGVYGQFISPDGYLIGAGAKDGSNFRINKTVRSARNTDLAFDAHTQRFFAVWDTDVYPYYISEGDIQGRFVDSKKIFSPLQGTKEIAIDTSSGYQSHPAVEFDRHNMNYLVVWREGGTYTTNHHYLDDSYIKGQMFNADGKKIGGDQGFIISGPYPAWKDHAPELAWEDRNNRFLVVWSKREHPSGECDIHNAYLYGRFINPNGTLHEEPGVDGELFFDTCVDGYHCIYNYYLNVAYDPYQGNFIVLIPLQIGPLYMRMMRVPFAFCVSLDGAITKPLHKVINADGWWCRMDKFGMAFNERCGNFMMSFPYWDRSLHPNFIFYGDSKCPGMAKVKTFSVGDIFGSGVTCRGEVVMDGGLEVTARGMCWSTEPGPDLSDSHTVDGKGMGYFKSVLTGLLPNTKYFFRAYATNSAGTVFGGERTFTTKPAFKIVFTVEDGGSLIGEASQEVLSGGACSPVKAVASEGFFFTGWTGDGGFALTLDNPLVVKNVSGNMNIVAGFSPIHLRGERIAARDQALKNDIGEIEISCEAIDTSLPLVFKLYRSIDGVGRQLVGQFSAADVADGGHHVLDMSLESRTKYEYVIEVLNHKGEKVGRSAELIL